MLPVADIKKALRKQKFQMMLKSWFTMSMTTSTEDTQIVRDTIAKSQGEIKVHIHENKTGPR